jgi:hypothetical protein
MSTIHFYIELTGEYIFFDNEIDMYEYAKKHNIDYDECFVYDPDHMGLKEITRDDIEHGGIDYSEECENLLDYIYRRPDAETDYLDEIMKHREQVEFLKENSLFNKGEVVRLKKELNYAKIRETKVRERGVELENDICGLGDTIKKLEKDIDDLKTQLTKVPMKSMNYRYMKNLEKENKQLIKKFDAIEEYIDLYKNENGLITNYELRSIDFRLHPEDYEPGI